MLRPGLDRIVKAVKERSGCVWHVTYWLCMERSGWEELGLSWQFRNGQDSTVLVVEECAGMAVVDCKGL